jgi:hypothetical protein
MGCLGERLEHVNPNFDVYMLGKVLWCMVAGWPVLKREYFDRHNNDVTKMDMSTYKLRLWNSGGATDISLIAVEVWECGTCHHIQFFRKAR